MPSLSLCIVDLVCFAENVSVSSFFNGEMTLQDTFLSKLKPFHTTILFIYRGSGREVAFGSKMAQCC